SPDGARVAFKVDVQPGEGKVWGLAVLELATGERTVLESGPRGVDDQVTWLDADTLLYGLPRADEAGVTDVWAVQSSRDATPRLLVEEAWSPTVVAPDATGWNPRDSGDCKAYRCALGRKWSTLAQGRSASELARLGVVCTPHTPCETGCWGTPSASRP